MKIRLAVSIVMALSVCAGGLRAEPGLTTGTFLQVPVGGRPVALGGAYTGMAEDAYGMHFNPAAMALSSHQVEFAHNEYLLDLSQEYVSYVHPLSVGAVGVSVNYFDLGNFNRTVITNVAAPNEPTSFANSGQFNASNIAISVGYGRQLFMDGLYVGGAAKYIGQQIDNFSDQGAAFDFGVYYRAKNSPLSLGLSVLNAGDKLKMKTRFDRLATTIRLGGAYRMFSNAFLVTGDVEKTVSDDHYYGHFGAEYWATKALALRIGWNGVSEAGNGLSFGAGVKLIGFKLDYAYANEGDLKQAHRISLGYEF